MASFPLLLRQGLTVALAGLELTETTEIKGLCLMLIIKG